MLAGLALLLVTTSRESLIVGFYLLLSPLRVFKLNPERFAARLWLTLHYVEQAPKRASLDEARRSILDKLDDASLDRHENEGTEFIQLKSPSLCRIDLLTLAILTIAGLYLICV